MFTSPAYKQKLKVSVWSRAITAKCPPPTVCTSLHWPEPKWKLGDTLKFYFTLCLYTHPLVLKGFEMAWQGSMLIDPSPQSATNGCCHLMAIFSGGDLLPGLPGRRCVTLCYIIYINLHHGDHYDYHHYHRHFSMQNDIQFNFMRRPS